MRPEKVQDKNLKTKFNQAGKFCNSLLLFIFNQQYRYVLYKFRNCDWQAIVIAETMTYVVIYLIQ